MIEASVHDIRIFKESVWSPFSFEDVALIFPFGALRKVRRIVETAPDIVDTRCRTGILNFFGEIIIGEYVSVRFGFSVTLFPIFVRRLIDVLYGIVVSRLVLPGKHWKERRHKNALQEEGDKEEGKEEGWLLEDSHRVKYTGIERFLVDSI